MPPIKKPTFPNPSTADLKKSLDTLDSAMKSTRRADGKLDVDKLEHELDLSSDPALELGLDRIKDAFRRTEMRTINDSCSGSVTREVRVAPKQLNDGEVQSVLSAIAQAKAKVTTLDTDHDGSISKFEAKGAAALAGLAGALAEGALKGSLTGYRLELRAWNDAVNDVVHSVDDRESFDSALSNAAEWHAGTPLGADAIKWAYRDLATQGKKADIWDLKDALENAETSFLRHIPFFGRSVKTDEGHLSNSEVGGFLNTDDLAGFIAEKKAAISARVGGDYESYYLKGADLDGIAHAADPDFHPVSSSC